MEALFLSARPIEPENLFFSVKSNHEKPKAKFDHYMGLPYFTSSLQFLVGKVSARPVHAIHPGASVADSQNPELHR